MTSRRRFRLIGTALLLWVVVVVAGAGAATNDSLLGVERLEVVWVIILGLMALTGLILLIVLNPFSGEWVEPERRKRSPVAWLILAALMAVVVWKPELIPDFALSEAGEQANGEALAGADSSSAETEEAETVAELSDLLFLLFAIGVVGVVLFLLRRRVLVDEMPADVDVNAPVLEADLVVALDELTAELALGSDPRSAVLAAYAHLESMLSSHGSKRTSVETPAEHLRRSLVGLRIDTSPLVQLGQLYEVARFSGQPVTDGDRQHALRALEQAQVELASLA